MAVVLSAEENNYFSSSPLRRTQSGKFTQQSYTKSPSTSKLNTGYNSTGYNTLISPSNSPNSSPTLSSPATLHADSTAPSFHSTPASSLSLDNCGVDDSDDSIVFPSYDNVGFYGAVEDLEPPASPQDTGDTGESYTVSPTSNTTSTENSRADSPEPTERAEDDTAVRKQPTRHVDYLSHNWREEDIWSSWRHVISKREVYSNSARLENASWRTWVKAKNKLKTVSPETLNWLKDCDVTWLYGPLQTGTSGQSFRRSPGSGNGCDSCSRMSKNNSFLHRKPILKKRSMSELMLQRSLSSSSLLKQAAAAVQAQQSTHRPLYGRANSDYVAFPFSSRRMSRENTSVFASISSSGVASPAGNGGEKHIHFNEQVEQCIAIDVKGDNELEEEIDSYAIHDDSYDSDSDDGVMMKRSNSSRQLPTPGGARAGAGSAGRLGVKKVQTPRNSFSQESKTIAMLPSTTLKDLEDSNSGSSADGSSSSSTDHNNGTGAMKHSSFWGGSLSPSAEKGGISPSPSQETLRPSKPSSSGRFLLSDEDEDDDVDLDWQPPSAFASRKDSVSVTQDRLQGLNINSSNFYSPSGSSGLHSSSGLHTSGSNSSLTGEPSGMRRTPSGMFMPYEEDEDDVVSEGLFGRVVDTVNTAKDIAHVIWNVGWRR